VRDLTEAFLPDFNPRGITNLRGLAGGRM